jgi:hypothetical protein
MVMSGTPVITRLTMTDGTLAVRHYQDVEDIIERNKRLQNEPQRCDWGRHVATIPNNILVTWLQQEWARGNSSIRLFGREMDELVARKLADPDWRWLRTDK